jgi:hypothetical protein
MEFCKAMDPALMSFSTKSAEPHMVALKRGVRPSYSDEVSDVYLFGKFHISDERS